MIKFNSYVFVSFRTHETQQNNIKNENPVLANI